MAELISRREYARRRGVHESAVRKAERQGRIRPVDGKIDPEAADKQWEANTLPQMGRTAVNGGPNGTLGGADPGHSDDYLAVLEYLNGTTDRLAPLLVRVRAPKRMRELLREATKLICEELERVGIV